MKKLLTILCCSALLFVQLSFAFVNGNVDRPVAAVVASPNAGDLFVSYTYSSYPQSSLGSVSVNVATVKIHEVFISPNIAVGETVPVSYVVENTGIHPYTINSSSLQFYKPTTGDVTNHYNVVSLATNPTTIDPGATVNLQYNVTPLAARTNGQYIVDGFINGYALNIANQFGDNYYTMNWEPNVQTAAIIPAYTREVTASLFVLTPEIISPNGAIDGVISAGQSFQISVNVLNLGEANVIGTKQLQIEWPAIITSGTPLTQSFDVGTVVNFDLIAGTGVGTGIVTLSIVNTAAVHPIDEITGVTVNYARRVATFSITVEAPASLNIIGVSIPTTNVKAYNPGPVTIEVSVANLGSADAIITPQNSDVFFLVGGSNLTSTYIMSAVPSSSMFIGAGQTITVNYIISTFGGGAGICTVNVTLNAIDQNSGAAISAFSLPATVATYNVTADAGVMVGTISVDRNPVGHLGSFEIYVPVTRIAAGANGYTVNPQSSDLLISLNPTGSNVALVSFNVTGVPAPFTIGAADISTRVMTYNVTVLGNALSGTYTLNVLSNRPAALEAITLRDVSDPDGGVATTNFIYDADSPELILGEAANTVFTTPNFAQVPLYVIAPTTNFILALTFSERVNALTSIPYVNFLMENGTAPTYNSGLWNTPTDNTFSSNPMILTAAEAGFVTISYTSGVFDLAGNAASASPNFMRFFVDALAPVAAVAINGGETITGNPLINVGFSLNDNFSSTVNMEMMILSSSDVSANPGITLNTWLPYDQAITLNLGTTIYGTKNIDVQFRDEAGNLSLVYADTIFLDADTTIWLQPATDNIIISRNYQLIAQTAMFGETISYFVSINNTLRPIALNVPVVQGSGLANFDWAVFDYFTAMGLPVSTINAQLIAVASANVSTRTANILNVIIDNNPPALTLNTPLDGEYVYGDVLIAGVATDNNLVTAIDRVEVSTDNGLTFAPVIGTANWAVTFDTLADGSVHGTVYHIVLRAYDLAGNLTTLPTINIIESTLPPTITINLPTPNTYIKNIITVSGNVTGNGLPIDRVVVRFDYGSSPINSITVNASGTESWLATINAALIPAYDGSRCTVNVYAYTATIPGRSSTINVNYYLDLSAPYIVTADSSIVGITNVAGTFNITGRFADAFSGVNSVELSVDGAPWESVHTSGGWFSYIVPITKAEGDTYLLSFRVADNTYITANIFTWNKTLTVDYSVLPTGSFMTPVSGSYVNNDVLITGTANVAVGAVESVQISFDNGAVWTTVNGTTNWNYNWAVPPADVHGTIYHPLLKIIGDSGLEGMPSPAVTTTYIKDIYGPSSTFLNIYNGMYLSTSTLVICATYTEGAFVSRAVLVVDGVSYNASAVMPSLTTPTQNVRWNFLVDFPSLSGSLHNIYIRAVDTAGNWVDSISLNIRTVPQRIVTEPLPTGGVINGDSIYINPIYATNQSSVTINLNSTSMIDRVYINGAPASYTFIGGLLNVIFAGAPIPEEVKIISIFETDGVNTTAHYQPVVYDITPPTANVIFNAVVRYYTDGVVAPNERFQVNVLDRTADGLNYGSGFSVAPSFNYVDTTNTIAGVLQRSIYDEGTSDNVNISNSHFDPFNEILYFNAAMTAGNKYDLSVYAVDNAGNAMVASFNIYGLLVDADATGDSGGIDHNKFITSFPNPYDPGAGERLRFTFYLKDTALKTRVLIYNEVGELIDIIKVSAPGIQGTSAGYNEIEWNGRDKFNRELSNGIYLFILVVEGKKDQDHAKGKMVILRR